MGNKAYYMVADLKYDLAQAGMDDSEEAVDRYSDAFSDAVNQIVGADVVLIPFTEEAYYRDRGYDKVPDSVWQEAHDMVEFTEDDYPEPVHERCREGFHWVKGYNRSFGMEYVKGHCAKNPRLHRRKK